MTRQRVVVTGVGLVSPLGNDFETVSRALQTGQHGIQVVEDWASYGVETKLAALAAPYSITGCSRKDLRTMGPVAQMAFAATKAAITDSGLSDTEVRSEYTALLYGSTDGSTAAAEDYYRKLYTTNNFGGLLSSTYLKFMSHTCAANLGALFGITGRVVPICSACTSASQAIGEGFEAISSGRESIAICGGAEELHVTVAGVFDLMLATSIKNNDRPGSASRPFDKDRDGLVVGEGAGTLVLESYDHAVSRGARIYGEILGFGSNCDGQHLTSPSPTGMAGAMRRSLARAGLSAKDIDYVNAHATGTEVGDIAESHAMLEALGKEVPVSSTKGHTGHTLGGCGAIESIFVLSMLRDNYMPPTRNLESVDPRCASLNYLTGDVRQAKLRRIMNNNFAFGGINTSLIFGRV